MNPTPPPIDAPERREAVRKSFESWIGKPYWDRLEAPPYGMLDLSETGSCYASASTRAAG